MKRPEAILFDMGGVLLESADMWDMSGFEKSFPGGLPEEAPIEWFVELAEELLRKYQKTTPEDCQFNAPAVIAEWLPKAGIDPTPQAVRRWYRIVCQWEVRPLYPWVRESLQQLHGMGFRLGVISNTLMTGEAPRALFRAEGIYRLFDYVQFSAEMTVKKPDPGIFLHVLGEMNLKPEDAWYVGDKPHRDVCGANGVGMTSVLVDSIYHDTMDRGPEYVPDIRIGTIADLSDVLANLPT